MITGIDDQRSGRIVAIQAKSHVAIGFYLIFGVDRGPLSVRGGLINHGKVLGNGLAA